ncbi:MAG: hypothetical protein NT166_03605 [Candidatus Aminicenantes bacterium]|nr:hypothetical protein [Candidatus Aminicenantes bacterium]
MKTYLKLPSLLLTTILAFLFLFPLPASAMQVKVMEKRIDIREKPDLKGESAVLAQVDKGTLLDVKEKAGEWYCVFLPQKNTGGATFGWVYQNQVEVVKEKKKDRLFLMGMGMLRFNWANVKGDEIRFRYSDLGLPADFSTRERASFMVDGTFGHQEYTINGHLNYDPENRITEPALEFLVTVGNEKTYLSVGDYQMGVMMDSVFSRYYHPFRGVVLGARSNRLGVELIGGLSRGEAGLDEFPADAGSGPYYLQDSPILRGSESVFLVTKSAANPDLELKRTALVRNRDYFIDYDRGAIIFNYSLYSFDELGNPVSVLVSYQYESLAGRFTRAVYGVRAFAVPLRILKLNVAYIADANKDQSLGDIFKNSRGILTLGLNVDSKPLAFFGEYSFSTEPSVEKQTALFGGGILKITKKLRLFFNSWSLDADFPTFANKQLQYGYSLFQIFPTYAERNIYLSPFQFTRNLGAELYPFSLARLSVDETETHGFLEWEDKAFRLSMGYGTRNERSTDLRTDTLYFSAFYNGEATKAWGKFGVDASHNPGRTEVDSRNDDLLIGVRQRVKKFRNGDIFLQADFKSDWFNDLLDLYSDTYYRTYSIYGEYLTGSEGYFAGYRKEILTEKRDNRDILDADVFEFGVRKHVYKGFFLDSRYRKEEGTRENVKMSNEIISLGAGLESKIFRAMARYEIQVNKTNDNEGRRRLWSLFLFGSPLKRMSISLRYYKQLGKEQVPLSLNEHAEEELSLRFLWRPWSFLNLYSQWRYDTNLELYPPLDRTRSNSVAEVHGLKLTLSKRLEFLANYKLLKVWGPIDNRKYAAAAEMGYLLFRHIRLGLGVERIDFRDKVTTEANYKSTVGYFKLVALY